MTADEQAIWERLLADHPIPDVKASPIGWLAWQRTHAAAGGEIVVARDAGAPVALATLATTRMPWRRLLARRAAPAGDVHWSCGYPITGRDVTAGVRALLAGLIASGGWDVLAFGPMLADEPVVATLASIGTSLGMRPMINATGEAPRVVFDGTWDAFYAARSGNLRAMVARGERALAKLGAVRLDEYRDEHDLDAALEAFFRIEGSGWKTREGTAIGDDPTLRALYTELAREAAARGRLRIFLLRSGEAVVAGDFCLVHDGGVFMLKTGYDEAFAKASPGQVLRRQVLAHLWGTGEVHSYDFLSGGHAADYKHRWANHVRPYCEVRLFHPRTPRGLALAGLVRLKRGVHEYR